MVSILVLLEVAFRRLRELLPHFEGPAKTYNEEGQVTGRTKSDRPIWLQKVMADEQVDTKAISNILNKAINKQPLTEKQQRVIERLMQDARTDYEKVGRTEVVLDDMQEGDKFIVDGETFTHKGHDEEGNAVIKDGITYKVPMFDREQIVGVDEFMPAEREESEPVTLKPLYKGELEEDMHVPKMFDPAEEISREIPETIEKPKEEAKTVTQQAVEQKQAGESTEAASPHSIISAFVKDRLKNRKAFTKKDLWVAADNAYGGKKSEGKYTPKDAYDAMELGINQYLEDMMRANPNVTSAEAAQTIVKRMREDILEKMPSQEGNRTAEQDEFQQFSTPPDLAYVMSWVANIKDNDVALEPSAGIGGLAVYAKAAGAKTVVNEFSKRRAAILKDMGFDEVYTENAEQLHNILPGSVKPTLVIMNPPFSSTAGRIEGQRSSSNVIMHLEQALQRLEPNGRLVALIGINKFGDSKTMRQWFEQVKQDYNLRAIIEVSGKGYAKYGTQFDNRIIVIDKTGKTLDNVIRERVEDVTDAIPLLKGVRDDRSEGATDRPSEQASAQQGSKEKTDRGEGGDRPKQSIRVSTDELVSGESRVSGGARDIDRVGGESEVSAKGSRSGTGLPAIGSAGEQGGGRRAADSGRGLIKKEDTGRSGVAVDRPTAHGSVIGQQGGGLSADKTSILRLEQAESETATAKQEELLESVFEEHKPAVKIAHTKKHPGKLVQSAAMSSVELPNPTYIPNLPREIIESGALSDAQIESVVYAGQAHEQILQNGERKGFFIGDGTGVGKGREIAAIILDNIRRGRKKAVWVSETPALIRDAVRDMQGIGMNAEQIFAHGKVKTGAIERTDGIIFTTYKLLAMNSAIDPTGQGVVTKKGGKVSRLDQLKNWLGSEFDGVIAFDEAHNMANAKPAKGDRGKKKPAAQALTGIALQKAFPKARIVYVSATGATEVSNLAYATRLGLWGDGTPFARSIDFITKITQGGLAAMEVVARDMKALGVYIARSLSYDDVSYGRLEHKLTDDQRNTYDTLARAWQLVLENVDKALVATNQKDNKDAKAAALSSFWGAHQRFFNQVITSMQMPSVIADIRKQLDAGNSVILQLVNTNEATQDRQLAKQKESNDDTEALDLTPREALMQYIENSFPTQQYEEAQDEEGNIKMKAVIDSNKNPVQSRQALDMRERLLDELGAIKVPDGPLEYIINTFGVEITAEVTGRTKRVVRIKDESGRYKTVVQNRSAIIATKEADEFQNGKRRILIFSNAGSTGRSFHADIKAKNQSKRIHYLIQPGWRADKAVQGFGRSHRTNQAQAPHYMLVMTDLNGQKRFLSSIARRLDQLGAMTKGQRSAASQGLFSEKDNLESKYAVNALDQFIRELHRGNVQGLDFMSVMKAMGIYGMIDKNGNLNEKKIPTIPKFLNRILSLEIDMQNDVFNGFYERLEENVEAAIAAGTLDVGLETYRADGIAVKSEETVYEDTKSGARTAHVVMEAKHKIDFVSFDDVQKAGRFEGFFRSIRSGKIWAVKKYGSKTDDYGRITNELMLMSHDKHKRQVVTEQRFEGSYEKVSEKDAAVVWEKNINESPKYRTEDVHLITGALLPIWDRLPQEHSRVFRVQTDKGKRYVGRVIHANDLDSTLRKLGAESKVKEYAPADIQKKILEGNAVVTLSNGWVVKRRYVQGEARIELTASDNSLYNSLEGLKKDGVFTERIAFETRMFLPTGEEGIASLEAITENRPIVDVLMPKGDSSVTLDFMGGQQVYEAAARLIRKLNPKAEDNIDVVKKKGDIGLVKALLASPEKMPAIIRYYVVHGKNAVVKQDRLRGIADDRMKEIFKALKTKEQVREFESLSWMGDMEGKTYTAQELDDMGVSTTVKEAYLKHRKFHEQAYRLLASHRKAYGGETGHREGHIPHFFENWNVYEMVEVTDENGETSLKQAGITGTFRSLREATEYANGLDPQKQYTIMPKMFKMPDELIAKTVLKDSSYFMLMKKMEDAYGMTRDEAFAMTNEIARQKNRRRFFGNVMKRKGQTGFRQDDLQQILKEYYYSAARYMALDDFKARVVPKFEKDFGVEVGRAEQALKSKNAARYVQEYINDVNGVPGALEDLIDASIKRAFGSHIRTERPAAWGVNKALHFTAVAKLGDVVSILVLLEVAFRPVGIPAYLCGLSEFQSLFYWK